MRGGRASIPERLAWPWAYFAVLGVTTTVAGGVLWTFWAKRWVASGRRRVTRMATFAVDRDRLWDIASGLRRWRLL